MGVARKFFCWLTSAALVISLVPWVVPSAEAAPAAGDGFAGGSHAASWTLSIDEMLSAGDYEEGSVIVVMSPASTWDGGAGDEGASAYGVGDDLLASARSLTSVSPEAYVETLDEPLFLDGSVGASSGNDGSSSPSPGWLQDGGVVSGGAEGEDRLSIVLLSDQTRTTREMLELLAGDDRVLFAQPDYLHEIVDMADAGKLNAGEGVAIDQLAGDAPSSPLAVEIARESLPTTDMADGRFAPSAVVGDRTAMQWGYENDGDILTVSGPPGAPSDFDMNIPDWNAGAFSTNAGGVVAVIDTGVDYTHPDLVDVMVDDMDAYNPMGGKHGINTPSALAQDAAGAKDPMDYTGHGTHVAGIVAAAWNGEGVSGAGNGVRIAAVSVAEKGASSMSDSAILLGCEYLATAMDNGLNVVAVNNSWGGTILSGATNMAMAELGIRGAAVIFASGNESTHTDNVANTSSAMRDNPYVVTVNAASPAAEPASFTNYGINTTDVFAPGVSILSTVPVKTAPYNASLDPDRVAFDTFESANGCVSVSTLIGDPVPAELTGPSAAVGDYRFDDKGHALAIPVLAGCLGGDTSNSYLVIDIKVDSLDDLKAARYASMAVHGLKDPGAITFGVLAESMDESGQQQTVFLPVEATYLRNDSWSTMTIDLREACEGYGSGLSYTVGQDGYTMSLVARVWRLDDQLAAYGGFGNDDYLYVDAVGFGSTIVPYEYMNGTSMATPAVTGAAAVLAAIEQGEAADEVRADVPRTADDAAELASLLKAKIRHIDAYEDLCSSGGFVDLSRTAAAGNLTPVISFALLSQDSGELLVTVKGRWFGAAEGKVSFGGKAAQVILWSETSVTLRVPEGLSSGILPVRIEAANGLASIKGFRFELPASEENDALPLFEKAIDLTAYPDLLHDTTLVVASGLGGYLYIVAPDSEMWAEAMYRYDPKADAVSKCADLPERLCAPSLTTYDGKLLLLGEREIDGDADASDDESLLMVLYEYDPAAGSWSKIKLSELVPYDATLANVQGDLLLFGGADPVEIVESGELVLLSEGSISKLDLAGGTVSPVGSLVTPCSAPYVAVRGSSAYLTGGLGEGGGILANLEEYAWDGSAAVGRPLEDSLPIAADPLKYDPLFTLAAAKSGLMVVGYDAVDDAGDLLADDTFVLGEPATYRLSDASSASSVSTATAFGKRALRDTLMTPRAYSYDGWLYVAANSHYEGGDLVLRATQIETLPVAGDTLGQDDTPGGGAGDEGGSSDGSPILAATGDDALILVVGLAAAAVCAFVAAAGARARL